MLSTACGMFCRAVQGTEKERENVVENSAGLVLQEPRGNLCLCVFACSAYVCVWVCLCANRVNLSQQIRHASGSSKALVL